MKINWESVKDFYKTNESVIGSIIFAGLSIVLYNKFNVPVYIGGVTLPKPVRNDYRVLYTQNPAEAAAISSLYNTAIKMTWDSDKVDVANDIYALIEGKETDEATRTYAINTLSALSQNLTWSSSKKQVLTLIKKIGEM